jgi:hypothetical protein
MAILEMVRDARAGERCVQLIESVGACERHEDGEEAGPQGTPDEEVVSTLGGSEHERLVLVGGVPYKR